MATHIASFAPTGNILTDGLLRGTKWAVQAFTFNFPLTGSVYAAGYEEAESPAFAQLNASMQTAVRFTLGNYASVANLTFTEIANDVLADMSAAYTSPIPGTEEAQALAWCYFPATSGKGGNSWYNNAKGTDNITGVMGHNDWATVLHELGHGLGLKHPHQESGIWGTLPAAFDYGDYTVMSYRSYAGADVSTFTNETWGYTQTLMQLDIAAVQQLYGANFDYQSGNTTYKFSPTTGEILIDGVVMGTPGANRIYATLWDGGGTDTYDLSAYATNLNVDLTPGGFSTFATEQLAKLMADGSILAKGNVANALLYQGDTRSLIENVIAGSGNDRILGNVASNGIDGGAGRDTFVISLARNEVVITTSGAQTILTSVQGVDTLINIEQVEFNGGLVWDIIPGAPKAAVSSIPAAAMTQVITGADPTLAQMDIRTKAAQGAYDYYADVLKVTDPWLGGYESLGVSFSSEAAFQAKYGAATGDTMSFVTKAYQDIFHRAANDAQKTHFVDQMAWYTNFYIANTGAAADAAAQQARGAIVGQMVAFVLNVAEERNAPGQTIDEKAIAFASSIVTTGVASAAGVEFFV